jgi:2-methylisocitrate lyase-like PEP mutase family enzyme
MAKTFRQALAEQCPLMLPSAHDALTAKLIEASGLYQAFQIGGFALDASAEAVPDIGVRGFDAQFPLVQSIMQASSLPVLVDADTGGDVKAITRVVQRYEAIGVGAIFIEDQKPPKKCGHMTPNAVIDVPEMLGKLRAAMAAKRSPDFMVIARTDAIATLGVDEAIRRAGWYADVADGVYVEGIESREDAERIGAGLQLRHCPLATSILEGGGKTPFLTPDDWAALGFDMLLFPTTILFQVATATRSALARLSHGQPMPEAAGYNLERFEDLLGLPEWKRIEETFGSGEAA